MSDNTYASELTPEDLAISATAQDLPSLNKILRLIGNTNHGKMIDLGCGYGGLTRYIAQYLGMRDVHGVEINRARLLKAQSKGIKVHELDLNGARLPFAANHFDLVTSCGALEHLTYFDNILSESFRILSKGGHIIIAMPNLASYVDRILLALGYQPRGIEISRKITPGVFPLYRSGLLGHIHSGTLRAMKQLIQYYGFQIVKVEASSPYVQYKLVRIADTILSPWPGLSRRFIILGRKLWLKLKQVRKNQVSAW
ncbi:MAG: methyltransferase domain-containing protein [Dehalococcoidia bacterium]|nr:MAG: methyltransferase domain-containing protein [Dehalococcoidia bacterium]